MNATKRRGRNRYVIFGDHLGRRQNIHLGRISGGECKRAHKHIKALVRSVTRGTPISDETQDWLDYSERHVRLRLAQIGLIGFDEVD